jgi:hypothetical protein
VQIDSGTSHSAFDPHVFQHLDIQPIDSIEVRTTSPTTEPARFNLFAVSIGLEDDGDEIEMHVPSVHVIESCFLPEEGIQGLLGRDILKHCLFVYDGKAKTSSWPSEMSVERFPDLHFVGTSIDGIAPPWRGADRLARQPLAAATRNI